MIWRVVWSPALDADLLIVSYDLAEHACAAVLLFVERGEGQAYPVGVDAVVWRFFVPGGHVMPLPKA